METETLAIEKSIKLPNISFLFHVNSPKDKEVIDIWIKKYFFQSFSQPWFGNSIPRLTNISLIVSLKIYTHLQMSITKKKKEKKSSNQYCSLNKWLISCHIRYVSKPLQVRKRSYSSLILTKKCLSLFINSLPNFVNSVPQG